MQSKNNGILGQIYTKPGKVYLCLLILAVIGIVMGTKLPISLYPNSTKPEVAVFLNYGSLSSKEFKKSYGHEFEDALSSIQGDDITIDKVVAEYHKTSGDFFVEFGWKVDPKEAIKEVTNKVNSISSSWPKDIRDSVSVRFWAKSSGFIAISFYSDKRKLSEIHPILEDALISDLRKVEDKENVDLWDPTRLELSIQLNPEQMTRFGLFPRDIENAINNSTIGKSAGYIAKYSKVMIQAPREASNVETIENILITTSSNQSVYLKQVADIKLQKSTSWQKIYKTSGNQSLILFANPKTGGNVKRMSEDIVKIVETKMKGLPSDIKYKVLVDPSTFIRSSIKNVLHEVGLAAGLAVLVLYIFLGSFRNTITAAIEIPLSMVLAFILMKMVGMNLNLISLGGLALSAGMNVDASVVVMENIFRHFENINGKVTFNERLSIIVTAVKEVMLPVIAATISSLVVFLPLAFTSNLTDAILGDLAKAVVFSHGFSAFVALLLVPTIRLQLMKNEVTHKKSFFEPSIKFVENSYEKSLRYFLKSRMVKLLTITVVVSGFLFLCSNVLPKLKKELIGTPDTDWMFLSVKSKAGNTNVKQMESQIAKVEYEFLEKYGNEIDYTFTQIRGKNNGHIMGKLKDKKQMERIWKEMEKDFQNTTDIRFNIFPWNPAELPIPDPPHFRVNVSGGSASDRSVMAASVERYLKEKNIFPKVWTEIDFEKNDQIILRPNNTLLKNLANEGIHISSDDLIDLMRVATSGKKLPRINIEDKSYRMKLSYPDQYIADTESIKSLPIKIKNSYIPYSALMDVTVEKEIPSYYRENGRDVILINAKANKDNEHNKEALIIKAAAAIKTYQKMDHSTLGLTTNPLVSIDDPQVELNTALKELGLAMLVSIALILLTLIFQFGSFIQSFIILTAVPLGIMGVILSLYTFNSTLSLNSVLGVILLNGIAVANSIILVDFINKLVSRGMAPFEAAIVASKKRLRPILITSLTTILGMIPIAIGSGEGGKILRPLGISVAGGLWFSMLFTLFFVPMLEVIYHTWNQKRDFYKNKDDEETETPSKEIKIKQKKKNKNKKRTQVFQ